MSSSSAVIPFSPSFCFDSSFPFPFPERTFLPQVSAARSSPTITHVIIPHISAMTEMGLRIILLYVIDRDRSFSDSPRVPRRRRIGSASFSDRPFSTDERKFVDMRGLGRGEKKKEKKEADIARQRILSCPINYSYRASIHGLSLVSIEREPGDG